MNPVYKALIVCTNHTAYPNRPHKTGLWLSEATHFYDEIADRTSACDLASPSGGVIPIDEKSLDFKDNTNDKWYKDPLFKKKLVHSLRLDAINPDEYQIIYFTGGHGAMWDFPANTILQTLTRHIYERGGLIAAVCHGVSGLLNLTLSDGSAFVENRQITGYSNFEEKLVRLEDQVPFLLEDALRQKKALYSKGLLPFMPHIEVDERLVTGQNPLSARKVGRKVMEELFEK